ncbi:MAG: N-acetylmuramoyl-L-alanine amidase [Clostridiales bacterium]|jgi:N-acetylmuramoyl-L-alanine amidase|nr:N-acetylmuramoyl-L-alanine amidase [Clostridiales bacterium]
MFLVIKRIKIVACLAVVLTVGATFVMLDRIGTPTKGATNPPVDIVLDAGHGDVDSGAVGVSGVEEKVLNLAVTLKVRDILLQNGISVGLTREGDAAIEPDTKKSIRGRKRADMAYRQDFIVNSGAKAFVSIHMNTFSEEKYKGAQVFYSVNVSESKEFGAIMQTALQTVLNDGNMRKEKQVPSSVYIMKKLPMSAVLVECGFISNREEEALLRTDAYQQKMAEAIAKGVMDWLNRAASAI